MKILGFFFSRIGGSLGLGAGRSVVGGGGLRLGSGAEAAPSSAGRFLPNSGDVPSCRGTVIGGVSCVTDACAETDGTGVGMGGPGVVATVGSTPDIARDGGR